MEVSRVNFIAIFSKEKIYSSSRGRDTPPFFKVHLELASPQDGPVSQDLVWGCLCCFQNWSLTLPTQLAIVYSYLLTLGLLDGQLGLGRVWGLWDCKVYFFCGIRYIYGY